MSPAPRSTATALCRALADPMRVRILNLCRQKQELSAQEISVTFGLQRSDLNRHVKYLEQARLIACRRVGQHRQYRFIGDVSPFHAKLIDFLGSIDDLNDWPTGSNTPGAQSAG